MLSLSMMLEEGGGRIVRVQGSICSTGYDPSMGSYPIGRACDL